MKTLMVALVVGFSLVSVADIPPVPPKVTCTTVKAGANGVPVDAEVKAFVEKNARDTRGADTKSVSVAPAANGRVLVCVTVDGSRDDE